MSQQMQPAPGEEAVKPSPRGRVSQQAIDILDSILENAHPSDIKRDFTAVLLHYIMYECRRLPDDFKDSMQSFIMILDWLEVIEADMDE
jgi:hypothetical protein